MNLRKGDRSQLALCEDEHEELLSSSDDTSKHNQGGLKHRKNGTILGVETFRYRKCGDYYHIYCLIKLIMNK